MKCADIIGANNLLQFIHQVTIETRFRKSLAQERFKSNLDFRNQIIISSIKFRKKFCEVQCILNAFYWYQIFTLDYVVVKLQKMFSSHGGFLHAAFAMYHHRETLSESVRCRIFQRCWNEEKAGMNS